VVEAVPAKGKIVRLAEQGEVVVIRDESIPVLRLWRFLGVPRDGLDPGSEPVEDERLVVVVEAGRKKIGLVIDELLGQQQVVVKSLEKNLHKVEGLMGATILGDGCVAPIIDVTALSELNLFSVVQQGKRTGRGEPGLPVQLALTAPSGKRNVRP
jgi:two-component system, chemotaxis family, sensor kinase CheA